VAIPGAIRQVTTPHEGIAETAGRSMEEKI